MHRSDYPIERRFNRSARSNRLIRLVLLARLTQVVVASLTVFLSDKKEERKQKNGKGWTSTSSFQTAADEIRIHGLSESFRRLRVESGNYQTGNTSRPDYVAASVRPGEAGFHCDGNSARDLFFPAVKIPRARQNPRKLFAGGSMVLVSHAIIYPIYPILSLSPLLPDRSNDQRRSLILQNRIPRAKEGCVQSVWNRCARSKEEGSSSSMERRNQKETLIPRVNIALDEKQSSEFDSSL